MSGSKLRIALCQINSTDDPGRNLAQIRDWVLRAAAQGARVVVFPEATMVSFGSPLADHAEPLDGPWADAVAEMADEHNLLVVAGMFTPAGDRIRNTVLVTGLGHHRGYHKIHLYDAFGHRESASVEPGTEQLTVTVDDVVLGVAICYDVRFPLLFQQLADRGADAVLLPTCWGAGPGKLEQWEVLVRARALDSGCWILGCDQADPDATGLSVNPKVPSGIGRSVAVDPLGRVAHRLGAEPGLLVTEIDHDSVIRARAATGVLANRVPLG
ncbi:carbon-nitrogen hydrolase family protein [Nocardia nova]|uniref:carbon-nitrogen hydrolase family protein n=1 Tax=Nocardia nova TaxID=37330 RepID=UPI00372166FD